MPFKSEKQRRWMYANRPDIAQRWAEDYNCGGYVAPARSFKDGGMVYLNEGTPPAPPTAKNKNVMQQIAEGKINANAVLVQDTRWSAIKDLTPGAKGVFTGLEELVELPGTLLNLGKGRNVETDFSYDVDLTPEFIEKANAKALELAKVILTDYYGPVEGPAHAERLFANSEMFGSLIDPTILVTAGPKIVAKLTAGATKLVDMGLMIGKVRKVNTADPFEAQLLKQAEETGQPVSACRVAGANEGGLIYRATGSGGCSVVTPDGHIYDTKRELTPEEIQEWVDTPGVEYHGSTDYTNPISDWEPQQVKAVRDSMEEALKKGELPDVETIKNFRLVYAGGHKGGGKLDRGILRLTNNLSPEDYQEFRRVFNDLPEEPGFDGGDAIGLIHEDPVTIYRGGAAADDTGTSWTTHPGIALAFSKGDWTTHQKMWEATVNKDDILGYVPENGEYEVILNPRLTEPAATKVDNVEDVLDDVEDINYEKAIAAQKGIDEDTFNKAQKQADETGEAVEICATPKLYDGGIVYRQEGTGSDNCVVVQPRTGPKPKVRSWHIKNADGSNETVVDLTPQEFRDTFGVGESGSKKKAGYTEDGRMWSKDGVTWPKKAKSESGVVAKEYTDADFVDPDDITFKEKGSKERITLPTKKQGMTDELKKSIPNDIQDIVVDAMYEKFDTFPKTDEFGNTISMGGEGIWYGELSLSKSRPANAKPGSKWHIDNSTLEYGMMREVADYVQDQGWAKIVSWAEQFKEMGPEFYEKLLKYAKQRTRYLWESDYDDGVIGKHATRKGNEAAFEAAPAWAKQSDNPAFHRLAAKLEGMTFDFPGNSKRGREFIDKFRNDSHPLSVSERKLYINEVKNKWKTLTDAQREALDVLPDIMAGRTLDNAQYDELIEALQGPNWEQIVGVGKKYKRDRILYNTSKKDPAFFLSHVERIAIRKGPVEMKLANSPHTITTMDGNPATYADVLVASIGEEKLASAFPFLSDEARTALGKVKELSDYDKNLEARLTI